MTLVCCPGPARLVSDRALLLSLIPLLLPLSGGGGAGGLVSFHSLGSPDTFSRTTQGSVTTSGGVGSSPSQGIALSNAGAGGLYFNDPPCQGGTMSVIEAGGRGR